MSTNYPTSLDTSATRSDGDVIFASHMQNVQDAVVALETQVGVDNSAVTTTLDYLVKSTSSVSPGHKHVAAEITDFSANLVPKSFSLYYMTTTETIVNFSTDVAGAYLGLSGSGVVLNFEGVGLPIQRRTITTDWAAADYVHSASLYGNYVYALMKDDATTSMRLYRYDKTNLAAGGTLMSTSGQNFGTNATGYAASKMIMDSSGNIYFTAQAGGSASQHIISKYTVSGTTLTFVSNTTCGSTSSNFERILKVDGSGNFYGWNYSVDLIPRKYNSSGTLVTTYELVRGDVNACINGYVYVRQSNTAAGGEVYSMINL